MRQRIFELVEAAHEGDHLSYAYDIFMMVLIVLGLIPLMFKQDYLAFQIIDKIVAASFIIDYLLRLITADLKLKRGKLSFLIYPFTPIAILDLICILPSLSIARRGAEMIRVLRFLKAVRVFNVFKVVRYSKSVQMIKGVFLKQRKPLLTVGMIALIYILIAALIMFNVEPDSFQDFFEAVYWATISLTAIGYGDLYPVTTTGRLVAMISSVFGIAVIALPAGIISVGFMHELKKKNGELDSEEEENG